MARTIILTMGTSVIGGLRDAGLELRSRSEAAQVTRGFIEGLGDAAVDLSAELGRSSRSSQEP